MADIRFHCSRCRQKLVIDAAGIGLNIPCPTCGLMLTVPPKDIPLPVLEIPKTTASDDKPSVPSKEESVASKQTLLPIAENLEKKSETQQESKRETKPEGKTKPKPVNKLPPVPKSTIPPVISPIRKTSGLRATRTTSPTPDIPKISEKKPESKLSAPPTIAPVAREPFVVEKNPISPSVIPPTSSPQEPPKQVESEKAKNPTNPGGFSIQGLVEMIRLGAKNMEWEIEEEAARLIALSSDGTSKDALNRLRQTLYFSRSGTLAPVITKECAEEAIKLLFPEKKPDQQSEKKN